MHILVADIGGTNIKVGMYTEGKLLAASSLKVDSTKRLAIVLPLVERALKNVCSIQKVAIEDCEGFGCAIACMVNGHSNQIITTVKGKYEDAPDIDLNSWAENVLGLKLRLETDVRAALIGEWQYGSGRGYNDLVGIFLGTGIGTAVLLRGKLLYGTNFQAGLLGGHFIINPHGRECTCGGRGCITAEASTSVLPSIVKSHPDFMESSLSRSSRIDYEILFQLAAQGDRVALQVMDRSIDIWSSCIVSLIHAFDPELVIMGGGIMRSADIMLPHINDFVSKYSFTPGRIVKVEKAQYLDWAALWGMSYIIEHGIDTL
jgi:glucokinase